MKILLHLLVLLAAVLVFVSSVPLQVNSVGVINEVPFEPVRGMSKCLREGGLTGVVNCAASRVLKSVEKAEYEANLEIVPGVTLSSDGVLPSRRTAKEMQEEPLPTDPEKKTSRILQLLLEATSRLISGRTLKVKVPHTSPETLARALEEGRGKMKKYMGPFMLGLGAKMVTMVPLMMAGLSLLVAKALLIGKVAFVVSLILFVQYYFSGRFSNPFPLNGYGGFNSIGYGSGYGGYGTSSLGPAYSQPYGPYARSIDVADNASEQKTAQEIAYSSHR